MESHFLETIIGTGFAVLTLFISYCISEVRKVKSEVVRLLDKERVEAIISSRRLDVLDFSVSEISEHRLSSRNVVEKGAAIPNVHPRLMKIIHGER